MITEYLLSFGASRILGTISLLVSFTLFVFFVVRAFRAGPEELRIMERLPLDPEDPTQIQPPEVLS